MDRLSNADGCEGQMKFVFLFVASEVQYNVHLLALANKYPSTLNCLSGIKQRTISTCIMRSAMESHWCLTKLMIPVFIYKEL